MTLYRFDYVGASSFNEEIVKLENVSKERNIAISKDAPLLVGRISTFHRQFVGVKDIYMAVVFFPTFVKHKHYIGEA